MIAGAQDIGEVLRRAGRHATIKATLQRALLPPTSTLTLPSAQYVIKQTQPFFLLAPVEAHRREGAELAATTTDQYALAEGHYRLVRLHEVLSCPSRRTGPRQLTLRGAVSVPEEEFYIEIGKDVAFVRALRGRALIIAPKATGKSTLAYAVRRAAPWWSRLDGCERTHVLLESLELQKRALSATTGGTVEAGMVVKEIHRLLNSEANLNGALDGVPTTDIHAIVAFLAANNVALLVDDAHIIFRLADSCSSFDAALLIQHSASAVRPPPRALRPAPRTRHPPVPARRTIHTRA